MKIQIFSNFLLLTSIVLFYCYSFFLTIVPPFARFRVHYRNTLQHASEQLIDLKDFKFLINSKVCDSSCVEGFLIIIIVFSALENGKTRNEIRNSWGEPTECTKIVFLLGTNNNDSILSAIKNESAKYGDILQGNFNDTYRNLTYKHMMGLKWVTSDCKRASFVVKTDDDVVIFTTTLSMKLQREPWATTGLVACAHINNESSVPRVDSKWAVSTDEFAGDQYPVHCSGGGIVYSIDVVPRLLEASYEVPFFWIEDVYITGMLTEKIGVAPVAVKDRWLYFDTNATLVDEDSKKPVDTELLYKLWRSKARRP